MNELSCILPVFASGNVIKRTFVTRHKRCQGLNISTAFYCVRHKKRYTIHFFSFLTLFSTD